MFTPSRILVVGSDRMMTVGVAAGVLALSLVAGCSEKAPAPKPPTPVTSQPSTTPLPTVPSVGTSEVKPDASARVPAPTPGPGIGATARPADGAAAGAGAAATLSTAESDGTRVEIAGLVMPKPVTWLWQKPSMQFRTLQYAVPAPGGASPDAELIFSLFPAGDGGPIEPNIDRWAGQFRTAEGTSAKPSNRSTREVDGMRVTRVDLDGAYMGMGAAAPRPNMTQLGLIVEAPDATVFVRLLGPEATVAAARKDFDALAEGLRRASAVDENK